MSSRSHCAADITAKFIDVATKPHGGQRSALIRLGWQTLCGARHIRSRDLGFALEPMLRCYQSSRSPSRAGCSVVALFLLAFSAIYSPGQDHFAAISRNGDGTWYYHCDLGFEIHTPRGLGKKRRCPMGATYRTAQLHAQGRTPRKSTRHRARQSSERPCAHTAPLADAGPPLAKNGGNISQFSTVSQYPAGKF